MSSRFPSGTMFLAGILSVFSVCAGELVLPAPDQWEIRTQSGDRVRLEQKNGIFSIAYDLNIRQSVLCGHVDQKQAAADLLLKTPIPLSEDAFRIRFEASGVVINTLRNKENVTLCPLLRDATGELLWYFPLEGDHLKAGTKNWSLFETNHFFAGEAGGKTFGIGESLGGNGNGLPDGKIEFLGFKLLVNKSEFGKKSGIVHLGKADAVGAINTPEPLFAYADAFCTAPGTYKLTAEIRNQFQGNVIRTIRETIHYDPQDPASRRKKLILPLGPPGNYWIRYQLAAPDGKIAADGNLRYETNHDLSGPLPPPDSPETAPALGFTRIFAGDKGVFERSEPFRAVIRVFPGKHRNLTLAWEQLQYAFDTIVKQQKTDLHFQKELFKDVEIPLIREPGRDAYRLRFALATPNGTKIDTGTWLIGIKSDLSQEHPRIGRKRTREEIKSGNYTRTTYLPPERFARRAPLKNEQELRKDFRTYLDEAKRLGPNVCVMHRLVDFEVLPGVYDFSKLDIQMDEAADAGCEVTVRFDFIGIRWVPYHRQRNYNGAQIVHTPYDAFSVTDPDVVRLWNEAWRRLYFRYKNHAAFQGYYLMEPGGEWTVMDKPWNGTISGYSTPDTEAFRTWLKERFQNIDTLNKRWGSAYRSFQEIHPPQPDLKRGTLPDLRLEWLDFSRFKAYLNKHVWIPRMVKAIRKYDQQHLIISYTILTDDVEFVKPIYGELDYLHNGGNQGNLRKGKLLDAWFRGRIGWISEPHYPHHWAFDHDGWTVDNAVWQALNHAGGGGGNLHIYFFPNPLHLAGHYGGLHAYDRLEQFRGILHELNDFRPVGQPVETARISDSDTLFTKHRTSFEGRIGDLERYFDLADRDNVPTEPFNDSRAAQYKLLLTNPLAEVLSRENAERIIHTVQRGARIIMTANTGKYVPELSRAPFPLLKRFGITPPSGSYRMDRPGVAAEAIQDHPLFQKGEKIGFFSLADYRNDLKDSRVKANFFSYPYRWIPETDYFGYYPENRNSTGTVLARFPEGAPAISLHKFGKGEILLFWGTPDYRTGKLAGFLRRALKWAGGADVPPVDGLAALEGTSPKLKRFYAALYTEKPGSYRHLFRNIPGGGFWYLDEMISGRKLGVYSDQELKSKGLQLDFLHGGSPLQLIRMIPVFSAEGMNWMGKYRVPDTLK